MMKLESSRVFESYGTYLTAYLQIVVKNNLIGTAFIRKDQFIIFKGKPFFQGHIEVRVSSQSKIHSIVGFVMYGSCYCEPCAVKLIIEVEPEFEGIGF